MASSGGFTGESETKTREEWKKKDGFAFIKSLAKLLRLTSQRIVDVISRGSWEALLVRRGKLIYGVGVIFKPVVEEGGGGKFQR